MKLRELKDMWWVLVAKSRAEQSKAEQIRSDQIRERTRQVG